jgi:hypothetical protein
MASKLIFENSLSNPWPFTGHHVPIASRDLPYASNSQPSQLQYSIARPAKSIVDDRMTEQAEEDEGEELPRRAVPDFSRSHAKSNIEGPFMHKYI